MDEFDVIIQESFRKAALEWQKTDEFADLPEFQKELARSLASTATFRNGLMSGDSEQQERALSLGNSRYNGTGFRKFVNEAMATDMLAIIGQIGTSYLK